MRKFLAIVRHEYRKVVVRWAFVISTFLFPVLASGFALVPALIFSIKSEPTRLAIVDQSGRIADRVRDNLSVDKIEDKARRDAENSSRPLDPTQERPARSTPEQVSSGFIFVNYDATGKPIEQVRQDLNRMAVGDKIDAYLIIPADISSPDARFDFRSRKAGDFVVNDTLKDAVNEAVRSERLSDANISEVKLESLSKNVDLDTKSINDKGEEKDSDSLFFASLAIGFMIYITLTIYGQTIMAAVVEEKETRIAEILFSSARPFQLMLGKLSGVGLAGLTQLAIWIGSLLALIAFLSTQANMQSVIGSIPHISPLMIAYFFLYFLIGYFLFASIFALIGSMVTTVQEGGQFAFPPILLMLSGFYFGFAVVRDPNSSLSFWVSILPFWAPLTMPVRILAETPPIWQIALSMGINLLAIAGIVWLTARVYRIGMLMYGKRATIPEVIKWIRQA